MERASGIEGEEEGEGGKSKIPTALQAAEGSTYLPSSKRMLGDCPWGQITAI